MRVARLTTSMKVDLVGASAPLGFFDPLGLSARADAKTLNKYRDSELKHGRVAMVGFYAVVSINTHVLYLHMLYIFICSGCIACCIRLVDAREVPSSL